MSSEEIDSKMPDTKFLCHSVEEEVVIDFTWVIDNFKECPEKYGEYMTSSYFPIEEKDLGKWYLILYPRGNSDNPDYVSLFLTSQETVQEKVRIKAIFRIVDEKDTTKVNAGIMKRWFNKCSLYGYPSFYKRESLIDPNYDLLINGKLMINCKLYLYKKRENRTQTQKILEENAHQELSMAFGKLYETENFFDIILSVNDGEIKAHKNVLSARSSVFAAMFAHDMKENRENRVDIPDISKEILHEMLTFIYTGNSPNLEKLSRSLLIASDKYDIPGLKHKCECNLIKKLCFNDATEICILADKYSAPLLKLEAMKFIKSFSHDVMRSEGWQAIVNSPKLLEEICQLYLVQRSESDVKKKESDASGSDDF